MSDLLELQADLIEAESVGDRWEANRLKVAIARVRDQARLEAMLAPVEEGIEI